jgi:folylpolyglutamate synthase/dihydropteroate synthase
MAGHHARKFSVVSDPFEALDRAIGMAQPEDAVFATGSLYLVGDLRVVWQSARLTQPKPAKPNR